MCWSFKHIQDCLSRGEIAMKDDTQLPWRELVLESISSLHVFSPYALVFFHSMSLAWQKQEDGIMAWR